jgi:hypothetical protein
MPFKPGEIPQGAKPFPKGTSGNPNGYPMGVPNRSTKLRKWLAIVEKTQNPLTGEIEELDQEDQANLNLIVMAKNPSDPRALPAIKELLDTLYGKNADVLQADVTSTINIVDAEPTDTE